jgi:hypothetical protein
MSEADKRAISPKSHAAHTAAEAMQRALVDACLSRCAGEAIAVDLRAFLEGHGVARQDIDAALAAPSRVAVYRSLVRNGLSGVVARMLGRTRARMNAVCDGRFDADLARFVDEVGPRTHYLRDVPVEFFAWVEPQWRADPALPAYLPDLALYELAFFAVAASESAGDARPPGEIGLDLPLAFAGSMRLLRVAWAVHDLPLDDGPMDVPERRDVDLLAYRDASHTVRWLEMTPLAASVVCRLANGVPLGPAVERACADGGLAPGPVLGDIAKLLADLGARGVLL